jgi:hypothetical protein
VDARLLPSAGNLLRMAATFCYVCLGWVFFRAATLTDAWQVLKRMATQWSAPSLHRSELRFGLILVAVFIVLEWLQRSRPHLLTLGWFPRPVRWTLYTGLLWLTLYFHTSKASPFIYFQF